MSLEQTFLDRIAAEPENSLHRQIYADWLEEQGDPRGELLRIQEQLRTLDVPDRPQVEQRMHQLIAQGVKPLTIIRTNSIGMKLVLIFPGQFRMGSPPKEPERRENEKRVKVTLTRGFWLGQFQVTQTEYPVIKEENPSHFGQFYLETDPSQHPVENVCWAEAREFCRYLTTRERAANRIPAGWEYTLPTEAQWEYSCRAGTTTATTFGNSLSSAQANFDGKDPYNGASPGEWTQRTMAVGSYQPNAWGLYDLHGNVYEWCRDCYVDELPGGTDPEVIETDDLWLRVYRGGSWLYGGSLCRSAHRAPYDPDERFSFLGFRVALVQAVAR